MQIGIRDVILPVPFEETFTKAKELGFEVEDLGWRFVSAITIKTIYCSAGKVSKRLNN